MKEYTQLSLSLSNISSKEIICDFDAGNLSSDSGLLLVKDATETNNLISDIAKCIPDNRQPGKIRHSYETMLRQRVMSIIAGYEDANDCNDLKIDPILKMCCDRLPETGMDLCSQSSMSRLENSVCFDDLKQIAQAIVTNFIESFDFEPQSVILDFDHTDSSTHGYQEQTLFNVKYGGYCYMPLLIFDGVTGKLISSILRPGSRPTGKENAVILRWVVRRLRKVWKNTKITFRGDAHFCCKETIEECEKWGIKFILGITSNSIIAGYSSDLLKQASELYQLKNEKIKLFAQYQYKAKSWNSREYRLIAKVEVSSMGSNLRYIITNITSLQPSKVYNTIYCDRGRAELFIKELKCGLHSDRMSCCSFKANQMRLFMHAAAYVLLHEFREKYLKGTQFAKATFTTIRNKIIKVASIVKEMVTRVRISFPSSFVYKEDYHTIFQNL